LTERDGGTINGTRYGAKGAGQMRTLRELETDTEIENDPMGDQGMDPGSLDPDSGSNE
jgi:hypothetical protein